METTERRMPRVRRSFTPEFKAEIVELCQRGDRSIGQVAREFDLTETAVREWVRQAERDAGTRSDGGLTSAERQELSALRRENQRLRQDVEILKRATVFFASRRPGERLPFIEAERAEQRSVKRACALLEVSRVAYYAHRAGTSRPASAPTTSSQGHIRQAHQASKGRYGAPRIHAQLRRGGHRHGRKRITRLMRAAGRRGRTPRRFTRMTVPDPAAAARADLVRRDFTVNAAAVNTRWCGDITYIPTLEAVAALNSRPRKTLSWKTPAEALNEQLLLIQQGGVATTP